MSIAPLPISSVTRRIQLLEVETKRSSTKKVSEADTNQAADSVEALTQEVLSLKKDVQTAERIAKQSEVPLQLFFSVINCYCIYHFYRINFRFSNVIYNYDGRSMIGSPIMFVRKF